MPIPVVGSSASSTDLVVLDDVATYLRWSSAQESLYAAQMAGFISAMTPIVEHITGPVTAQSFDDYYSGGRSAIIIEQSPVIAVSLVTESYGSSVIWTLTEQPLDGSNDGDAYGYTLDYSTGLLIRRASGVAIPFAAGQKNVHITYTAGMCADTSSVPPNIWLGTLELIRFNWQPEQGGNRPQMGQEDLLVQNGVAYGGFFIPNRVVEILKPSADVPGIA